MPESWGTTFDGLLVSDIRAAAEFQPELLEEFCREKARAIHE